MGAQSYEEARTRLDKLAQAMGDLVRKSMPGVRAVILVEGPEGGSAYPVGYPDSDDAKGLLFTDVAVQLMAMAEALDTEIGVTLNGEEVLSKPRP